MATKKNRETAEVLQGNQLDSIKKAGIVAMFADDELMEQLVLKGGNAMDIVHQVNSRASVDLDFSAGDDLDHGQLQSRITAAVQRTYDLEGYYAFDIKVVVKPGKMPDELAAFWGGYQVEFKLISKARAAALEFELEALRREAIKLGEGTKFTIDISRHEYVEGKEPYELDGYTIYVYSPEMIVCEKLRAICQQMPEYAAIIQRKGLGNQRARDFIDIEALVRKFAVDLTGARAQHVVSEMFRLKRVPLHFLSRIPETRDLHALGYAEVRAAMKPGVEVQPFDYYFDFICEEIKKLKTLWDV